MPFNEKPPVLGKKGESDGKSFNYAAHVVKPADIGGLTANPFSLVTTLRDNLDYAIGGLLKGHDCKQKSLTLGNRMFVASGVCGDEQSVPECRGKTRYIYVDNVPTNVMPCLDTTQPFDPNCKSGGTGMMTGMVQDILHLNPFELIASATGKGSIVNDACVRRTETVGHRAGADVQMHLETRCAPRRKPLVCSLQFGGSSCYVYSKSVNAERVKNGKIAEHAASGRAIDAPAHSYDFQTSDTGGDEWGDDLTREQEVAARKLYSMYMALYDHAGSSMKAANALAKEGGRALLQPDKNLRWIEVGQTRQGQYVYALHDDSACQHVSDLGVRVTEQHESIKPFELAFRAFLRCLRPGAATIKDAMGKTVPNPKCTEAMLEKYVINTMKLGQIIQLNEQGDKLLHREHSNRTLDAVLVRLKRRYPLRLRREPPVIKELPVNKYHARWRQMVTEAMPEGQEAGGGAHERFSREWRRGRPGEDGPGEDVSDRDEFLLKLACFKRHAACKNNYLLFEWVTTVYRKRRTYGFQILWRAYRNKYINRRNMYITHAEVIGNPIALDIRLGDAITWETVEGFQGGHAPAPAPKPSPGRPRCPVSIALAVALALAVAVALALALAARPRHRRAYKMTKMTKMTASAVARTAMLTAVVLLLIAVWRRTRRVPPIW